MTYSNRPTGVVEPAIIPAAVEYHDRVRWGPIFAGLVVAISAQLILSALGAAIGSSTISTSGAPRSNADDVGTAVGIWAIISLFISLIIGSWVMARCCGPMNRGTAMLNGAVLWATTLALSAWLLASGVSGAFGVLASNAGEIANQVAPGGDVALPTTPPGVTAQQARDIAGDAAKAGWSFTFGSLLGLVASLIGASIGTRKPRTVSNNYVEP
jgi:hypothetical protein